MDAGGLSYHNGIWVFNYFLKFVNLPQKNNSGRRSAAVVLYIRRFILIPAIFANRCKLMMLDGRDLSNRPKGSHIFLSRFRFPLSHYRPNSRSLLRRTRRRK
jgi:hypothetical protein